MADAVAYNQRQGFSSSEVAFIQRVVGSDADGKWGPNTIAAIEAWQTAHDIPADGMIKRSSSGNTWPRMLTEGAQGWTAGGITRVGLWTFTEALVPTNSESTSNLELALAAKLTDVSFTINTDSAQTFALPSTIDDIVEIAGRYKQQGIDVSLNAFVFPCLTFIDALADAVLEIHRRVGLRRLDVDAEELWIEHGTQSEQDAAADRLGQRLDGAGLGVAVNGIVYTSQPALDPLVRQACVTHVTPQAYSVANRKTAAGAPDPVYNPIDLQHTANSLWSKHWPSRTMVGGFATYDQAGTYELGTLTEDVAIGLALRTWADLGVNEVFGWSIKSLSSLGASVLARRE